MTDGCSAGAVHSQRLRTTAFSLWSEVCVLAQPISPVELFLTKYMHLPPLYRHCSPSFFTLTHKIAARKLHLHPHHLQVSACQLQVYDLERHKNASLKQSCSATGAFQVKLCDSELFLRP